jgi:predicted lysophospholipase L1 biosynthesis ABC-type transport system permease subunit
MTPQRLAGLHVLTIAVGTSGAPAAIEHARTMLETAYPDRFPPATPHEDALLLGQAQQTAQEERLAEVIIIASLVIGGCTLAAGVAGGLAERKRPFSLLRLAGTPIGLLRTVVALESAVPLLAAAAVATGAGFLAAHLYLVTQMRYTLLPPVAGYWLTVAGGLAAALGIIASTLPLLRRLTGPETARND